MSLSSTWAQLVPAANAGSALTPLAASNGPHEIGMNSSMGTVRLCPACCSRSPHGQSASLDLELLRTSLGYGAQLEAPEAPHARARRHLLVVTNALQCSSCGACVGREAQAQLGTCGAVQAAAMALRTLLAAQPAEPSVAGVIPLALQSLAMLCMDCPPNGRTLAEADGAGLMHAVLSHDIKEPAVLAHACELLGAMFPYSDAERQVELVATVAAGAAQRNHAAVACASSYALGMMVRTVKRGNMDVKLCSSVCSRALHAALVLLSSFPIQAGPLLKNCLGLVETVAVVVPHVGAEDSVQRTAMSQMLDDAYVAVLRALNVLQDPVSQVSALRCVRALLLHNPIQRLGGAEELVSWATRATSSARFNNLAVARDAALIQVHGICLVAEVLQVDKKAVSLQSAVLEPEVHAALSCVASVACDPLTAVDSAPCQPVPDSIGVCLRGPLCPLNHESLTGPLVCAFASACAVLLHWHMSTVHGAAGVNSLDSAGTGILHKLSASGLPDALHAFLTVAGGSADFHLRDAYGNTPLQVAQNHGQGECAHILSLAAGVKDAAPASSPLMNHSMVHSNSSSNIVKSLSSDVMLGSDFGAGQQQAGKSKLSSLWAWTANNELTGTGQLQQPQLIGGRLSAQDPVVECGRHSKDSAVVTTPSQKPTSPAFTVAVGPGSAGGAAGAPNSLSQHGGTGAQAYDHWRSAAPGTPSDGTTLMAALQQHAASANELATSPKSNSSRAGSAHTDDLHSTYATAERAMRDISALHLSDESGQAMGNGGFRVDTGMLSHLLGVAAGGKDGVNGGSVPDWLSAGLAAAISTRNEAAAAIAAATASGRPLKPEDIALLAEADQLLNLPGLSAQGSGMSDEGSSECGSEPGRPSKHLWLGNLNTKLPRSVLKAVFEHFGAVEDVVTFPGRMYAFVNFKNPEDAARAVDQLNDREVPHITGLRRLVVKFRPSKKALGKLADGPGADAAAARAANATSDEEEAAAIAASMSTDMAGKRTLGKSTSRLSLCSSVTPNAAGTLRTSESLDSADLQELLEASREGNSQDGDDGCVVVTGPMCFGQKEGMEGKLEIIHATGSEEGVVPGAPQLQVLTAANASKSSGDGSRSGSSDLSEDADVPEGKPSRHLWLGNIPLKPNKAAMELLFAQFGALESVRCFPGKTFAFVNFINADDAIAAKTSLDGQSAPAVTGLKPLAIRFQKDTSAAPSAGSASVQSPATTPVAPKAPSTPPSVTVASATAAGATANATSVNGGVNGSANSGQVDARKITAALLQSRDSMPSNASAPNLLGLAAVNGLNKMLDDDMPPEPAVNLSNRLNPNNVHYDKELAARYKRMNKAEKEALWAQDRAMQQMANSNAAAALLSASSTDTAARLLQSSLGVHQLAALASHTQGLTGHNGANGLSAANLAHLPGLADAHGLGHLLPRAMSTPALDAYIGSVAAAAVSQLQPVLAQGAGAIRANSTHGLTNMGHNMSGLGGLPSQLASALSGGLPGNVGLNGGVHGGMGGGNPSHAQLLQQLQQQQQQQQLLQQLASHNALATLQQQLGLHSPSQQLNTLLMQQQQQQLGLNGGLNASGLGGLGTGLQLGSASLGGGNGLGAGNGLGTGNGMYGKQQGGLLGLAATDLQQLQQAHVAAAHAAQLSQLAALSGPKQLPATFMCPLSRQIMLDPVVAADGVTYERSSITDWLLHNSVSPVTRQKLANQFLAPNYALKAAVMGELGRGVQQGPGGMPLGMGGLGGL